eukprot:2277045-Amphidinium_carterae.3
MKNNNIVTDTTPMCMVLKVVKIWCESEIVNEDQVVDGLLCSPWCELAGRESGGVDVVPRCVEVKVERLLCFPRAEDDVNETCPPVSLRSWLGLDPTPQVWWHLGGLKVVIQCNL